MNHEKIIERLAQMEAHLANLNAVAPSNPPDVYRCAIDEIGRLRADLEALDTTRNRLTGKFHGGKSMNETEKALAEWLGAIVELKKAGGSFEANYSNWIEAAKEHILHGAPYVSEEFLNSVFHRLEVLHEQ